MFLYRGAGHGLDDTVAWSAECEFLIAQLLAPGKMTPNKATVEAYLDGFRKTDREQILSCLTDDVEWEIPGVFHVGGKEAFAGHIVDDGFVPPPEITLTRLTESGDLVVAEGRVRARRTDHTVLDLAFCDVFEMEDAKIRRLISYLMEIK